MILLFFSICDSIYIIFIKHLYHSKDLALMCTRIFNNLNSSIPMTGRNFDWHYPLNTYIYRLPAGDATRFGADQTLPGKNGYITWQAEHASICTYLGSDKLGFAAIDGINEHGLVANGLEDILANFNNAADIITGDGSLPENILKMIEADRNAFFDELPIPENAKLLCSLRWVQFVLDKFDSVRSAAEYFNENPDNIFVYSGNVPDGRDKVTKTKLHLTLSDSTGNSAIIELRGNGFSVNESPEYNVATVTPRFEIQQLLLKPWLDKWQDPKGVAGLTLYDVPGGTATHQRFARANYFYIFSTPFTDEQSVLAQTRSLMATCATPLGCHFKQNKDDDLIPSATSLWCSVSDHSNHRYHLINSLTLVHQWADFKGLEQECQRALLIDANSSESDDLSVTCYGDLGDYMQTCSIPFMQP
jgi:penicillin V acylase-like amidase (Ntn superfamily)